MQNKPRLVCLVIAMVLLLTACGPQGSVNVEGQVDSQYHITVTASSDQPVKYDKIVVFYVFEGEGNDLRFEEPVSPARELTETSVVYDDDFGSTVSFVFMGLQPHTISITFYLGDQVVAGPFTAGLPRIGAVPQEGASLVFEE